MEGLAPDRLIRLSRSCLSEAEKQAVMGVLDRDYLGMGSEVQQFEQALEAFLGRSVACVVTGTAALHLALQACDIGPGDEVLVQSLTYVASFQAISATGATPVACDIDPSSLTLDLQDAERRLTPNTKAIMPVHYAGDVGALSEIYAFAQRHTLRVIEDAAHAFGTEYQGKRVGSFGDIACFSFDGIKNITSGEGGCIATADEEVMRKIKDARLLGVEKDSDKRYKSQRSWDFDVSAQGWRYHMSNLMAAIGQEQLKRFDEFASVRKARARLYDELLDSSTRVEIFKRDYSNIVPHIYAIRIHDLTDRKALQAAMLQHGVQTGVHYQPNHLLTLYRTSEAAPLNVTDEVYPSLLTLPLHPKLSETDVRHVVTTLEKALT